MEGVPIKLIIKTPNQQIRDQIVKCDSEWTIGRLKEYLSEVYPSKPKTSHQKLIYFGQLLNDSVCLKDVLRQCNDSEDQAYTVHLVCAPQKRCANKMSNDRLQEEANTVPVRNNTEQTRSNVQNQNQESSTVTEPSSAQLYSSQYFDPRNGQQMAWMQQAYTHYFTQYMQLVAAQGIQLQPSIPYIQQMNINTNDSVQNTYMNNNNNVGDEQPQPAAQEAADIDAANNAAGEDGAFNRDWLDLFYTLSRIIVLFSIVSYYASPLKFFIVTFFGFVIYLYQSGIFRIQLIILPENNNGRAENNNQAQPQQNGQPAASVQSETQTNATEENEEERPGVLAFTWTFFSSFFASLLPEQPNDI